MTAFADGLAATLAPILVGILAIALVAAAVRMIAGPGYADRFIALDMLAGLAVAAAALSAVATGRREFLDVALGIALIGFVATVALAAFLEKKKAEETS